MQPLPLSSLVAAALLALGCLGAAGAPLREQVRLPQPLEGHAHHLFAEHAQASLFGELRASLSDFLILKADRTHHRGVRLRAITPSERAHQQARADEHEEHEEHHEHGGAEEHEGRAHHDETTVVPPPDRDWRGILGEAHRCVAPVFAINEHEHGSATQTIALYWLATRANPRLVHAYVEGAFVMRLGGKDPGQALRFLQEGARHNPLAVELQAALGELLFVHLHDAAAAEPHLRRALELAAARAELTEDEAAARRDSYRYLVHLLRRTGREPEARQVAREGLALLGDDPTLRRAARGTP